MISNCLYVNEQGHLTIGGMDTLALAKEFGTPLYVMDENTIRNALQVFKASIEKNYKNGLPYYASKAFSCKEMYRIVASEECGIDVVSSGELYTALEAGFPADKIFFHGNNKSVDEIKMALEKGVGRIIVDDISELDILENIAKDMGKKQKIMFRIKPGVDAHTHDFVRVGKIDSKFGFALENGEALHAVKLAADMKNIELTGLHCHIGSQIFETEPFVQAAETMLIFMSQIKSETGIVIRELNLGGGFGIKYLESDDPKEYGEYMDAVSNEIHSLCDSLGLELPAVFIEPGRSVVGPAGITLYSVGVIKNIKDVRTYLTVDGGLTDNPRPGLYDAEYSAVVCNRADAPCDFKVTVAGRCCETDLLIKDAQIQQCDRGDILAVLATGAYNFAMSNNYNRLPRPAVVMVKDGKARVVVKRETLEDLIRNDI